MIDIKLGKYQHYKGNFYQVIGNARHSETLEEMVVYKGLYESEEFGNHPLWVRPAKMFFDDVTIDGKTIKRFTYVTD